MSWSWGADGQPRAELVAYLNPPPPRGFTGAGWVLVGALIGLIVIVGTLLGLAWLAV